MTPMMVALADSTLRYNVAATEPVIMKHRFAVAIVALQMALPATAVIGTLYLLSTFYGMTPGRDTHLLAILSAFLTLIFSVRRSHTAPLLDLRILFRTVLQLGRGEKAF
jgi:hypothetical protein